MTILGLALAGAAPAQTADPSATPAAPDAPPTVTAPAPNSVAPVQPEKTPEAAPEAETPPAPSAAAPARPVRAPRRAPRRAARPAPAPTVKRESPPAVPEATKPAPAVAPQAKPAPPPATDARPFLTEYQDPEQRKETPLGRVLLDLVVKLGIVLAIAYGSLYALRGVMARQGMAPGRQRHLRVLESASLGPNRSVHVVRIGEKVMVVGSTPEQVTMLAEVDDAETLRQMNAERDAGSFQARLAGALTGEQPATDAPEAASLPGQVRGSAKRLWDQVQDLRDFRGRGDRS